jgi:hypothetical protein
VSPRGIVAVKPRVAQPMSSFLFILAVARRVQELHVVAQPVQPRLHPGDCLTRFLLRLWPPAQFGLLLTSFTHLAATSSVSPLTAVAPPLTRLCCPLVVLLCAVLGRVMRDQGRLLRQAHLHEHHVSSTVPSKSSGISIRFWCEPIAVLPSAALLETCPLHWCDPTSMAPHSNLFSPLQLAHSVLSLAGPRPW